MSFTPGKAIMRVGILTVADSAQLQWAQKTGFRSMEWVRFDTSLAGPTHPDWKPFAEQVAAEAKTCDLRISAIAALYRNPLDPRQTEYAGATFRRAIEVASHIGVKTVAGFPGAI